MSTFAAPAFNVPRPVDCAKRQNGRNKAAIKSAALNEFILFLIIGLF